MFIFALLIISLLFLYVLFSNKRKQIYPEPPATFFFGHALELNSTTNIINAITKYIKSHGDTIQLRIGPKFAPAVLPIITTNYKFIEFILSSNKILRKSENYQLLKPWLGSGLLISDGVRWKKHRKMITPAFHFEILKQFVSVFESVGTVLTKKLHYYANSSSIDLYPLMSLCTLDIICETAMGTKINAQDGENSDYVRSVKEMCRIVIDRSLSPLKLNSWSFILTKDYQIQKRSLNILHGFTSKIIKMKKESNENCDENNKKMAFLDLLLKYSKCGNLMSFTDIREEVDTFMFEGHDTTAAAISYTLFCLANDAEIQGKVLQEQKELFNDEKNPKITYQDLQNMKYLDLVIKESLRLYPIVPFIGRYTTEEFEFNGKIVPKNTNLVIFIYGLHRNPQVFPDPEKFNPDRFKNFDSSLPYAYIPFSAGPRNCIGQKFAMLEMKNTVSNIIRHFELISATPKHKLELAAETVLKSVNGIRFGLKKRI